MSHSSIFLWELMGTAVLMLLINGTVASVVLKDSISKSLGTGWVAIVLGASMGVFTGASVAAKSGGNLNPAVTLSLAIDGRVKWSVVPYYWAGQMLGAIIGATLAWLAFKPLFDSNDANETTGGIFFTGPAVRKLGWNMVTEAIGTFVLMLWVLTNPSTNAGLGASGVAWVVVAIGFALGSPTGFAINPARDLGPRIAYAFLPIPGKGSCDWSYAWVPVVGPLLGGAIAAVLVKAVS